MIWARPMKAIDFVIWMPILPAIVLLVLALPFIDGGAPRGRP